MRREWLLNCSRLPQSTSVLDIVIFAFHVDGDLPEGNRQRDLFFYESHGEMKHERTDNDIDRAFFLWL